MAQPPPTTSQDRRVSYSHYQPPPQPIHFPYHQQQPIYPQHFPNQPTLPMTNFTTPNIGNPFQHLQQMTKATTRTVGQGQDFELFGTSTTGGGGGNSFGQPHPQSIMDYSAASLPDLIPDQGSPSSSASAVSSQRIDSPPLQQSARQSSSLHRPSLQSLNSDRSNGSYRGEGRASSVPPPEFPRPMRRKTQENHHWPSFVTNGSNSTTSSSTSSSASQYLPQHNLSYVDEPSSYTLPPSSSANSTFDPASLSLSPAQYPYVYQAPHTDHPLLPSEQSDLLDRVRRDLLDVDLSSIKGPLRALALSGGGGTEGAYSMMSPLPSFNDYRASIGSLPSLPLQTAADRDKTPTPNYHRSSPPSTRSPAIAALQHSSEIGTVSPQEAFLDYPAVDSKLHDMGEKDGKLARSDFGVGVGHSLFAPLPTSIPLHPSQVPTSKNKNNNKVQPMNPSKPPATTTLQHAFPTVTTTVNSISSRSPTPQQSSNSTSSAPASQPTKTARNPHPFSVPQNAVSWATRRSNSGRHLVGGIVDGDVDDEDGDFGEPSSSTEVTAGEEEDEYLDGVRRQAGLPQGFGRFDKKDLALEGDTSMVERARYGTEREGQLIDEKNARPIKEENGQEYGVFQPEEEEEEEEQAFSFIPPPPLTSFKRFDDPPPPPTFASPKKSSFLFSSSNQPAPIAPAPSSSHGTSTPRRAAAANALAGLQAQSSNSSLDESNSVTSNNATAQANRSKRQRKRSRLALEEDDDDDEYREEEDGAEEEDAEAEAEKDAESDEYQEGGGGGGGGGGSATRKRRTSAAQDESDGSYRSSSAAPTPAASARRSGGGGGTKGSQSGPAPKRRRRAPATEGKGSNSTKGSISCDHVSTSTGEKCGVVFRRPYDLARHKETIHGETLGGEKLPPGKAKEWKCGECGGTFSRKDALLRHGRIRGHKPGV